MVLLLIGRKLQRVISNVIVRYMTGGIFIKVHDHINKRRDTSSATYIIFTFNSLTVQFTYLFHSDHNIYGTRGNKTMQYMAVEPIGTGGGEDGVASPFNIFIRVHIRIKYILVITCWEITLCNESKSEIN